MDCKTTRLKIEMMFGSLSPDLVDFTRAQIQGHLLKCESCRTYLKECYCKKKEGIRK